jgi:hypothetical protein
VLYLLVGLAVYIIVCNRATTPVVENNGTMAAPAPSAGDIMGVPYSREHTGRPAIKGM